MGCGKRRFYVLLLLLFILLISVHLIKRNTITTSGGDGGIGCAAILMFARMLHRSHHYASTRVEAVKDAKAFFEAAGADVNLVATNPM